MSKQDCLVIVKDKMDQTIEVLPKHSKYLSRKDAQREAADQLGVSGVHRCVIMQKVMEVNQPTA